MTEKESQLALKTSKKFNKTQQDPIMKKLSRKQLRRILINELSNINERPVQSPLPFEPDEAQMKKMIASYREGISMLLELAKTNRPNRSMAITELCEKLGSKDASLNAKIAGLLS